MNIDIALHGRSIDLTVIEKPLELNHILWAEPSTSLRTYEYVHKGICFHQIPLVDEVSLLIHEAKFNLLAVVISPDHSNADILKIKEDVQQEGVPLIMYTPVFSQRGRDRSIRLGVDD